MDPSAGSDRLRWLLTFVVVGVSVVALLLWWRASSAPDPAVLLPAPSSDADPATVVPGEPELTMIAVDVVGAVQRPGLYYLSESSRVDDVIKAAGGFAPDADRDAINLAVRLKDEQQLRVPRVGESVQPVEHPATGTSAAAGRLNLNSADAQALEALPGIGPVTAGLIVEYRSAHGPFQSVDQLQDVNGVGDATISTIRDLVTVDP